MSRLEQLFGIDSRSLGAFRVGLGALLLVDLAYRTLDFRAHYTDAGVLPRALYLKVFSEVEISWSLHLVLGSAPYTAVLFLLAFIAALALMLGRHARAAALVSWVLLVSLHNRQPLVVSGSDMVLRLLLFWSLFLPLGGPPSWDRSLQQGGRPRTLLSLTSAALLIQVILVYAFSCTHKLLDPAWTQLVAIEEAMRVEGVATTLGRELLAYPGLLRVATASTLATELVLPLLAFVPWATARIRVGVVIAMWAFHLLGIGGTMNLGLFEYVMALAWVPFLPSLFWDRVLPRWKVAGPDSPERDGRSIVRVAGESIAVLALCLIIVDNVVSLDRSRFRSAQGTLLRMSTRALALSQQWRLWSTPLRNRYYVFPACLEDGSEVDLHTGERLDWDRPRRASRNHHWWKYQLSLTRSRWRSLRPAYADLLVREWNAAHAAGRRVTSLELVKIDARRADEKISMLPREVLWRSGRRDSGCGARRGR